MLTTSKMLLKSNLLTYKRWLEYIPDFWNINNSLTKNIDNITLLEQERLKQIKEEREQLKIINKFLNIIDKTNRYKKISEEENNIGDFFTEVIVTRTESNALDLVIKNFDFNYQAKTKLEPQIVIEINNIINLYNGQNKEELINIINKYDNIYYKEYALYLLNERTFQYSKQKRRKYLKKD